MTMTSFAENATAVLVHGAWADGSCWRDMILPLERSGLRVICASIPLTTLTEDISALTRALARAEGPVVLGGHAYGGAVIAGISDERVKSLVYIAALAPDEGETVAQVFYRNEPHPDAPKLTPDDNGFIWMPEAGFARAVAQRASEDQTKILNAVQRPISVQCIQQPAPSPSWKTKPSWYLLAEEDRMINPRTQRFMSGRMNAKVQSSPVDHSPMYTAPDLVVDVVLQAARETVAR